MPRESVAPRSRVLSAPKQQGFYAAARKFSVGKSSSGKPKESGEAWQQQGWNYYDTVPEFHYAVNWVGNLLSRARLVVKKDGKAVSPEDDEVAREALHGLFGGREGQQEMFRQLGIHFTVAGEAYVLGLSEGLRSASVTPDDDVDMEDEWYVVASTQLQLSAGKLRIWSTDVPEETDRLLVRLWRPHPQMYLKSDAPTRAALPILEEIVKLSMHIAAQLDSRLSSAGILFLPTEVDFSGQEVTYTDENGDEQTRAVDGVSGFAELLTEVASTAIRNRNDASALVPIVVQVPSDALEKVQHLTFWSGLDENAEKLRTEAIRRLSLGLDMPPEVLTGTGDMNHWGAWQVDESAIKSHSEPLLQTICSSLSRGYLRGLAKATLPADQQEDVDRYAFAVDTSEMRMRPNRSKEAIELYDRGITSKETVLRENGFDVEDDIMPDDEFKEWMRKKVASGSTTPEIVAAALEEMGILFKFEAKSEQNDQGETQEGRPTPSLEEHPLREEPGTKDAEATSVVAAAEVLVYNAMKRAGNKLKNRMRGVEFFGDAADRYLYEELAPITAADADELLEGSWTALDRFNFGVPSEDLQAELHSYSKALLVNRTKPNREHLTERVLQIKKES